MTRSEVLDLGSAFTDEELNQVPVKKLLYEKWEKMTPEEREQFKEHIHLHRPPWLNRYPEKGKNEQA